MTIKPNQRLINRPNRFSKSLASLCLGCAAMMALQSPMTGADKRPVKQARFADVQLQKDGLLLGFVLDDQGNPLEKAIVKVTHKDRVIATAKTNQRGAYAIQGLRGGVHVVDVADTQSHFRFWTERTAPPAATKSALTVTQGKVVRAQWGVMYGTDPYAIAASALGVAALVVAIEKQEDINDLRVEVDRVQASLHDHPPASP